MTGPTPTTILSGLLLPDDNSLPMLLDYLHQCERSGALHLHTPHGVAQLYYDAGQLHHAQFQGHRGLHAVAVLMQVHDQAAFTFQLHVTTPERSIATSLGHLLMNAAQILDEGHAPALDTTPAPGAPPITSAPAGGPVPPPPAQATTPTPTAPPPAPPAPPVPDIAYDLVPAAVAGGGAAVTDDTQRRVLGAVNARRSVGELARLTRLGLPEVTAAVAGLVAAGAVTLGPPLLHQKFWIELLRLTNTVAGKDGDRAIADALQSIGAVPGAIPVARGRAFLQRVEEGLGPSGSTRRTAFARGCYQLRMMILNATNTTEEDWKSADTR